MSAALVRAAVNSIKDEFLVRRGYDLEEDGERFLCPYAALYRDNPQIIEEFSDDDNKRMDKTIQDYDDCALNGADFISIKPIKIPRKEAIREFLASLDRNFSIGVE